MYQDVLNVPPDSLLKREMRHALFALLAHTKMNPDKNAARLALQAHGLLRKAPSLKPTVSLFVDMELTAPLDWFPAWNVPRTVTLENHLLMDSKNALLALMTSSPSNLEQTKSPCAERNVNLAFTPKLDLPHALLVPRTFSNPCLDNESALNATQRKKHCKLELPPRMSAKMWFVPKVFANMEVSVLQYITDQSVSVPLDLLELDVKSM